MTVAVLTIAGSDPSGGAGVQADLRTFAALHVVGVSAITALTVQNSRGVFAVHPVPAEVLAAQIDAVLCDTQVAAVKIGMLGGAEQVRAVAALLRRYQPPNIVLDPVLASTGGVPLLDEAGRIALVSELLPLCHLVTPNLDEAAALPDFPLPGFRGPALLKGGHLDGEPIDRLCWPDGTVREFGGVRIDTPHTHGTGCFLSSAIAAFLARGMRMEDAIAEAKNRLTVALLEPVVIGQGRGHPEIRREKHLELLRGVYVLTDPTLRSDRSALEIARAAFEGGAQVVQLRDKSAPLPRLISLARELVGIARQANGLLIVNDRVDVALAADADGVHLGPEDMAPEDARRLLGPGKLLGVSVATLAEAGAAAPYASYLAVGAIYGSQTKCDAGTAIGTERVREIKAAFPHLLLVAIGGISRENIGEVAGAGADAAAVVSAVVSAPDMADAVRDLARRFALGKQAGSGTSAANVL